MSDRGVSVSDAAEHLGVARSTIYRWIEVKGLSAYRVGCQRKLKLEDVDPRTREGGASRTAHDPRDSKD